MSRVICQTEPSPASKQEAEQVLGEPKAGIAKVTEQLERQHRGAVTMQSVPKSTLHRGMRGEWGFDMRKPGVKLDGVGGIALVVEDGYGGARVEEEGV